MKFSFIGKKYKLDKKQLEKVAEAAFSVLGNNEGEIELILVSSGKIQELNKKYRKTDEATDVLSFAIETKPLIGQIFICYTLAKIQAKTYQLTLEEEIERLVVHGITHIYGYSHKNLQDEKKMTEKERLIIKKAQTW